MPLDQMTSPRMNTYRNTRPRRLLVLMAGTSSLLHLASFGHTHTLFGAQAISSSPLPFHETQPNGQIIQLKINGDPKDAWMSDMDGYTVLRDPKTRSFVYAERDGRGGLQPSLELVTARHHTDHTINRPRRHLQSLAKAPKKEKHLRPSKRDCRDLICGDQSKHRARNISGRHLRGNNNNKPLDLQTTKVEELITEFRNTFNISNPHFQDYNNSSKDGRSGHDRKLSTTGTLRNLVVLLKWADHGKRIVPSPKDIDILMNNDGRHRLCPTGSIRDVFLENSYGALQLESTVTDWIMVNITEKYVGNGNSGTSKRLWEAIEYALEYLDSNDLVDFDYFDADQDGKIDAITFLHSGYGAEFGGTDHNGTFYEDRIWSHKWELDEPIVSQTGVQVQQYHISPSLWGTTGDRIGRIGVIAHETGHFLGVPDLYDIDGGGLGIGCFDFMADSWGVDANQYYPPHMSAWTKLLLGWVVPYYPSHGNNRLAATELQDATLPQVFAITEGFPPGEFLLIENRQRRGFDSTLPQSGIVIYHIDHGTSTQAFVDALNREGHPGQSGWPQNGNHYGVAVAAADGQYDLEKAQNCVDAGDFYHAAGVNQLVPCKDPLDCQFPNTDSYQGGLIARTNVHITNISLTGDEMSFYYRVGDLEPDTPGSPPPTIPTAEMLTAPSSSPSEFPITGEEHCRSSGSRCVANDHCCSGFCQDRKKRFSGQCL